MTERNARAVAGWDRAAGEPVPVARRLVPHRLLAVTAARVPNKEALRFEDRILTYAELDALANRAANGLLAKGARPGDAVAVLAGNEAETMALIYGLNRAGLSIVPLNPRNSADEIAFQIDDAKATAMVGGDGWSMSDVLAAGHDADPGIDVDEDAFFHTRFTSGTTGKPKCIATTNRSIANMHQLVAMELSYRATDVALVNAPLAHASFHIAAGTVAVGGTLVLQRGFDPRTVWEDCDRHGVTHVFMVPTMFAMAADQAGSGASIRQFLSMASAFPLALKEKLATRFPQAELFEMYGATELGLCTVLRPEDSLAKGHTVGQAGFGYRVRVLDENGADLPPGEIGEIYVQGPSTCHGFVGSVGPSPTAIRDGWLSVGDLGSLDADGFLAIADRRSDLIISGGLNVYPAEVEDAVLHVDGVREVAVIGLPHEVWGQQVVAVVVGDTTSEAIEAYCREHLSSYKVPRRIEFVDELPKSATGKVQRRDLRDQFGGE